MTESVTSMAEAADEKTRDEACALRDLWARVSRQHLSGGQACSCGFGGILLQASDFETDIVEYLSDASRRAGLAHVAAFIEAVARRGDSYSLSALLGAIADPARSATTDLDFALARLRQTLESMNEAHGAGRFVCD